MPFRTFDAQIRSANSMTIYFVFKYLKQSQLTYEIRVEIVLSLNLLFCGDIFHFHSTHAIAYIYSTLRGQLLMYIYFGHVVILIML